MLEPGRAAGPLDGQVALITGSSSGLGKATAIALAQAGADVALLARGKDDLERAAAEVTPVGRRALVLVADLTLAEELTEAVDQMLERFGRVDVLVNAAGTDRPGPVIELGVDDWDQVLAVNLRAPFVLAKAVFPRMRQAGRGTIVNVSSVAGKRGWANAAAYCASKFGLSGLTQALAAESRPHGVRACVLYPGAMSTNWGVWSAAARELVRREPPPRRRAVPPGEVAALIVWLAAAPDELVVNEAIVSPLEEQGWP